MLIFLPQTGILCCIAGNTGFWTKLSKRLGICNPIFLREWVIGPTPNLEGQWFSVGVFLPLAHRFQLLRGTGHSPLAAVTRLPKHSQGLRWRGLNLHKRRNEMMTMMMTEKLLITSWGRFRSSLWNKNKTEQWKKANWNKKISGLKYGGFPHLSSNHKWPCWPATSL